jgi:two-component system chemotaxis response regulator CheB
LGRLAKEPAGPTSEIPFDIRLETAIASQEVGTGMSKQDQLGKLSRFSCPECHGTLWEIEDGSMIRYRCHVGHAHTADAVLASQTEEVERTLWTLFRAQQERAALARRMAASERRRNQGHLAEELEKRAKDYDDAATLVKDLLAMGDDGLSGGQAAAGVTIDYGKEVE